MSFFNRAQELYQRCLEINPTAHATIKKCGLQSGELALSMGLGWIDGKSFKQSLTVDERKECVELELFGVKHSERFQEALSFPLFNNNSLVGFGAWKPEKLRKGLLGKSGISNHEVLKDNKTIILTDSFPLYIRLRNLHYSDVVLLPFVHDDYSPSKELNVSAVQEVYVTSRRDGAKLLKTLDGCDCAIKSFILPKYNDAIDQHVIENGLNDAELYREAIKKPDPKREAKNGQYVFTFDDVTYYVTPLNLNTASLKVVLTAEMEGEGRYTDRCDLYVASARRAYSKSCAEKFVDDYSTFESDLHQVITELEKIKDAQTTSEIVVEDLSNDDEAKAKSVLLNPNILEEFLADMKLIGFVGEEQNLKLGFLVVISRLLSKPLSVIVQSSSGTGKSFLLNALCDITPPESLIFMSKLTPSSLYYMSDLRHKLLCVDESNGSEGSLYPLRTLQSNHKLVLACPMKDSISGGTITKQILVEGPVSFMESTTSDSLHPENASRAIILKMDESPEQTLRILKSQRQAVVESMEDDKNVVLRKWQNVQRLLSKQNLKIFIPYAHLLKFPTGPNARRDNQKMISLIQSVTLLKSFQREIKNDCVFADLDDYRIAFELIVPLLGNTQDELSERGRELLTLLSDRERTPFTRRQLMEEFDFPYSKVWRSMADLLKEEIIVEDLTPSGQAPRYVLLDTFIPDAKCKGLLSPDALQQLLGSYSSGVNNVNVESA